MKALEESGEDTDELRRQYLLRRFWQTAGGFWGKRGRRIAWVLSIVLFIIILLNIAASYGMNLWNRAIFDALEKKDASTVLFLSMIYFAILAASVTVNVTQVYARMTLQRRWRRWLTDNLVDRWLKGGRYYQLNLVSGDHQNPEYRIADDVRIATESPVDFVTGVVTAFLSAATFIVVLWTIGGALEFTLGGFHVYIPGFLVIAAVLYAVVASTSMAFIGRRFVAVSEDKNQSEAELRYVLTRLRENGESIALIQGEEEERAGVERSLKKVLRTWRDICFQNMKTTIVSQTSSYIAPVLPIILCAPKFLDGTMSLGEVMQAASAFTIVQGGIQLAGRQLSAARRLDRVRAPRRLAHGVARCAGTGGKRRRRRPHHAQQRRRRRGAAPARSLGNARRRHRGGGRHRRRDHAGRARAGRRRVGDRQEHAGARHRRPMALGRRPHRGAEGGKADAVAAAPLYPDRHAAQSRHLSGRGREPQLGGGRGSLQGASGSSISSIASTTKPPGIRPCRGARSSAWHLPAFSFTIRISSCWTRRPRRSTRRARTS